MKLIEADKVKRAMKDYWKAQVDKASTLTFIDGNEADKRINSYLEHNHELLKAIDELPSIQPERKDALEKDVAVEAISDELMSRFDVSATYGYDFAEAVINRIEAMAKELERGEQE